MVPACWSTCHQTNLTLRSRLPGTGEYNKFYGDGAYNCVGWGTPLYKSTTKFDSGCGWPAFFEGLPGAIHRTPDPDGRRVEITCASCGGHLGHVFKGEGFKTPTDERHCVNSVSIKFTPASSWIRPVLESSGWTCLNKCIIMIRFQNPFSRSCVDEFPWSETAESR